MNNKLLTIKEQKYVKFYIETGNATEAVWRSYNVKRREVAAVMAKQLKRKHHIQKAIQIAIENAFTDEDSMREKLINNLFEIATAKPKRAPTMNQVIKARTLLLKIKGVYGNYPKTIQY